MPETSLEHNTCLASMAGEQEKYKSLANAKRPCDCSMLCLCPKSSLCSCPHYILDMKSFGCSTALCAFVTKVTTACNNGAGQFKPIFQLEGNTFRSIFLGYFIADWLLYNFAAGSFHTTKLCSRLYSVEIEFYSGNWNISFQAILWGT